MADQCSIAVGGIRLAYQVWGSPDAPPLVLLHGWTGSAGSAAPALVIAGGPQSSIPQDRVAELARRIPGARLETIPAGHLIHAAAPEAFTKTALTFLRSAEASDHLRG